MVIPCKRLVLPCTDVDEARFIWCSPSMLPASFEQGRHMQPVQATRHAPVVPKRGSTDEYVDTIERMWKVQLRSCPVTIPKRYICCYPASQSNKDTQLGKVMVTAVAYKCYSEVSQLPWARRLQLCSGRWRNKCYALRDVLRSATVCHRSREWPGHMVGTRKLSKIRSSPGMNRNLVPSHGSLSVKQWQVGLIPCAAFESACRDRGPSWPAVGPIVSVMVPPNLLPVSDSHFQQPDEAARAWHHSGPRWHLTTDSLLLGPGHCVDVQSAGSWWRKSTCSHLRVSVR